MNNTISPTIQEDKLILDIPKIKEISDGLYELVNKGVAYGIPPLVFMGIVNQVLFQVNLDLHIPEVKFGLTDLMSGPEGTVQ